MKVVFQSGRRQEAHLGTGQMALLYAIPQIRGVDDIPHWCVDQGIGTAMTELPYFAASHSRNLTGGDF
jgi:hypothetical protein